MNAAGFLLVALNYALIVSLPLIFFEKRDRRRCSMWWLTAAPFIVLPCFVALTTVGLTPPFVATDSTAGRAIAAFAIVPSVASIALVLAALSTHRVPLPQWHQDDDLPNALVMRGPYSWVRHPFYLSYLLMFLAVAAVVPNAGTIGTTIYAALMLNRTAAREERRLCASNFGADYRDYVSRTGRFLPPLARRST